VGYVGPFSSRSLSDALAITFDISMFLLRSALKSWRIWARDPTYMAPEIPLPDTWAEPYAIVVQDPGDREIGVPRSWMHHIHRANGSTGTCKRTRRGEGHGSRKGRQFSVCRGLVSIIPIRSTLCCSTQLRLRKDSVIERILERYIFKLCEHYEIIGASRRPSSLQTCEVSSSWY
jgi:hypothetical protein